jgi:hypothetical protein
MGTKAEYFHGGLHLHFHYYILLKYRNLEVVFLSYEHCISSEIKLKYNELFRVYHEIYNCNYCGKAQTM